MPLDIMRDYVPVNERIAAFYETFPDGSLQSEIIELSDTRVVMRGYAYRTADDARPGIGTSSESIPGRTPYTRFSEVENCETSAWGRAIAALGFEVKRGIATAEDVRNKAEPADGHVERSKAELVAVGSRSSTEIPEPPLDWDVLDKSKPEPFGTQAVAVREVDGTMTTKELLDRADSGQVPVDALAQASKKLYGPKAWQIKALTDVQRYTVAVEVGLA